MALHSPIVLNLMQIFLKKIPKQECIPVGCIPPAAVAACWGGGSAAVHAGIPPRCGPGDPPGCGPGDSSRPDPLTCPQMWAWRPARHAGIPPTPWRPARNAGYHLHCMLGYHPPHEQNDRHM